MNEKLKIQALLRQLIAGLMRGDERTQSRAGLPSRPSRRAGRHGYTLIEVMFSVAILGVGLLGLYALHTTGINAGRRSAKLTVCRALADQEMEYLMGLPWTATSGIPTDLSITSTDPTSTSNPYAFFAHPTGTAGTKPAALTALGTTSTADGVRSYYRTWDVSYPFAGDTTVVQIKVRVIYFDVANNQPHGVTISSFRYQDPA